MKVLPANALVIATLITMYIISNNCCLGFYNDIQKMSEC
jgi:hypothetical protein